MRPHGELARAEARFRWNGPSNTQRPKPTSPTPCCCATGIATTADYEKAVHSLSSDLLADYWLGSPHLQDRLAGLVEITVPPPATQWA